MNFSKSEKFFIFFSWLICFCIGTEYAITRPASNGIFLTTFSAQFIPWVWLATVPFNLLIVYLYNRLLPKVGPLKMLISMASAAMGVSLLCALLLPLFPQLVFFHFIWKDIYILFMFKQLWSLIHVTIAPNRSKYLYGIIFGMGMLGSIVGSAISGFFAKSMGSENLFFLTLPIYALLILSYRKAMTYSPIATVSFEKEIQEPKEGISLILRNRLLFSILMLVVFMQISVGLAEYQFNTYVELNIFEKDLRTEYCGRIFGLTSLVSLALQFIGSFLLVHLIGVKRSHLLIPLILLANGIAAVLIPSFALITFSFVLVKMFDFSLFGVVKEMLYIPLKLDEKFRAKAIIDVFAYRSSKALVSLAILGLQIFATATILKVVSFVSVLFFAAWLFFVYFFLRPEEQKQVVI